MSQSGVTHLTENRCGLPFANPPYEGILPTDCSSFRKVIFEGSKPMFDLEQFTAACAASLKADSSHKSVREVVARAVADPAGILKALGEPNRPEIQKLYHAPDMTILNVIWGPMMTVMPHDHHMWAVIGIYT